MKNIQDALDHYGVWKEVIREHLTNMNPDWKQVAVVKNEGNWGYDIGLPGRWDLRVEVDDYCALQMDTRHDQMFNNTATGLPARIAFYPNGELRSEDCYVCGVRNNPAPLKPACLTYYRDGNKTIKIAEFYENGLRQNPQPLQPAIVCFHDNGTVSKEAHFISGKGCNLPDGTPQTITYGEDGNCKMGNFFFGRTVYGEELEQIVMSVRLIRAKMLVQDKTDIIGLAGGWNNRQHSSAAATIQTSRR